MNVELSPWKEQDSEQLVRFLNFVSNKGKFELTVPETIEFYRLLSYMQSTLKPKIDQSLVGEIKVIKKGKKEE